MSQVASRWGLTRSAFEICRDFPLGDEARALLKEGMPPEEFLSALQAGDCLVDACRFLAHALPKWNAVLWACACVGRVVDAEALATDAAFAAAERWVKEPSEEHRRAALSAAEAAEVGTPGGLAALAAAVSGGSLAPPTIPPVSPGPLETARAVVGVVLLAAVQSQPEKGPEKLAKFLNMGKAFAQRPRPAVAEPRPPFTSEKATPAAPAPTPNAPSQAPNAPPVRHVDLEGSVRGWVDEDEGDTGTATPPAAPPPPPAPPRQPAKPAAPKRNTDKDLWDELSQSEN
jgi:hypothetical protein